MADQQRVHPLSHDDAAAAAPKPTAPLVSRTSFRSENGDPERQPPSRPSKPPKTRRCCTCKRCLCWTICLLILLILIIGILAAVVYFVFDPKAPKYSVDAMRITQFSLAGDNSLTAAFGVDVTATNPNKKIGIYYEGGSRLSVWYATTELCQGSLPKFYQGHRNTTRLSLTLTGQTRDASGLMQAVQAEEQATGMVPLDLRARVPVRLKLGKLKLMKWKFLVRCRLVVNSQLQAGDTDVRISDSSCKFKFRL